MKYSHNVLR